MFCLRRPLRRRCDATGGSYVPADDAADLASQLSAVSSRAVQRFQASGSQVDGGPARTEATPIEPGTAYVDDIVDGESRWYSFEASEGQPISATLTDDGSKRYGCCMFIRLCEPDGDQIEADNGYSSGSANTYQVQAYDDGARDTGTFYFHVELRDTTGTEKHGAVGYELTVDVAGEPATPSASASHPPPRRPQLLPRPPRPPRRARTPTAGTVCSGR